MLLDLPFDDCAPLPHAFLHTNKVFCRTVDRDSTYSLSRLVSLQRGHFTGPQKTFQPHPFSAKPHIRIDGTKTPAGWRRACKKWRTKYQSRSAGTVGVVSTSLNLSSARNAPGRTLVPILGLTILLRQASHQLHYAWFARNGPMSESRR